MEQHEAPGSNATGLDGNQDASDANARDDRYMHSHGMSRDEYYRYELDRLEREPPRDASTRERWRKEEAWIGAETEIGPMKEEVKKQIIEEYERKKREATAKAEAEEMHIIVRLIREQQEA